MMAKQFKLTRPFSIQIKADKLKNYGAGVYDVPGQMTAEHAERARMQHLGRYLETKKVPENKAVAPAENKARVAKKTKHRRGAGAKSDA